MRVRALEPADRERLADFVREKWGSELQAFRGQVVRPADYSGFVAEEGGAWVGVGYVLEYLLGLSCKLHRSAVLHAVRPRQG